MKRIPFLAIFAGLLLLGACKKKDTPAPTPTPPASPYYFKFTFGGTSYNFNANIPQYMPFYANEAGGYQVANLSLWPSTGIRLTWPAADTVKESDLLALIGKTLYFSDTTIHPELSYDLTASTGNWLSVDTANTAYNIKITNVTYLKKDTTFGYNVKTYVITGTCAAVMTDGTTTSVLTAGSFNFIISRRDL